MSDIAVGAVIVRHIDELEAGLRYANNTMEPMLATAMATVLDEKRRTLGWAGEVSADFDETQWLAPEEWRMGGNPDDDDFYLYFSLGAASCIDGHEPATWIGTIAGFAGAGLRLFAATGALSARAWKTLLKSQGELLEELVAKGFVCDLKTGDIALTVPISRDSLVVGFEEDVLEVAFEPLGLAVDRINAMRPALDRFVQAIKQQEHR